MDELLIKGSPTVRELVLNRPDAHNALTTSLIARLADEVARAAEDDVRVIILHGGESRSFCAGADLNELAGLDAAGAWSYNRAGRSAFDTIAASPVPIIAAVHGAALGGGFELAMASTLILASNDAGFGLPEAGLGLIPGYGGTQRLPALVERGPALAIMLAGIRVSADRAHRLGLLADVPVASEQLVPAALALAARICAAAPLAIQLILSTAARSAASRADLDHETTAAAVAISSPEAQKRIEEFLARRSAR